jgi:BirA family transcriptional regulator, biotin operon repressor / biotin---[acetyl-CoA-carboxylase] ligase
VNPGDYVRLVRERVTSARLPALAECAVLETVDSTNDYLLRSPVPNPGRMTVCVAAQQSAGKGRRGRTWLTPPGSGICLSIGWTFSEGRTDLSALSLAVGVGVRRALQTAGAGEIGLKWPNDLYVRGGKLGGILAEVRYGPTGIYVVIGIGLNVQLSQDGAEAIRRMGGRPPRDLGDTGLTAAHAPTIVALVLEHVAGVLQEYTARGFEPFRLEWIGADQLKDQTIEWTEGTDTQTGIARGITADGRLRVESRPTGQIQHLAAGDVTLRRTA